MPDIPASSDPAVVASVSATPLAPQRSVDARTTIADVARHAGVSKATVSRFLNRRDELLTRDIAARVEKSIAELDYKPSPVAQGFKHGRTRLVGLVVADIANPFSIAVLRGAEKACQDAGYLLALFNLGNEAGREREAVRVLSSYQVDGLILNRVNPCEQTWSDVVKRGKPVVLVDRRHQGLDADFVSVNNTQAMRLGLEHLLAAGYQQFMLVTEPCENVSTRTERAAVFAQVLREQDKPCEVFESTPSNHDELVERVKRFRMAAKGPAAIVSGNAVATLRVATAVSSALGWHFGRDLGFVGFDETEWASLIGEGLTTIAQPTEELGRLAARCLIERLQGLDVPARHIELPGSIIVRGSSSRPS